MSSLTRFWEEYQDPVMVLLIFFAWLAYIEVEFWRNTGHVATHWTILQGPAIVAMLFYALKVMAVRLGEMIRKDRLMEEEQDGDA